MIFYLIFTYREREKNAKRASETTCEYLSTRLTAQAASVRTEDVAECIEVNSVLILDVIWTKFVC